MTWAGLSLSWNYITGYSPSGDDGRIGLYLAKLDVCDMPDDPRGTRVWTKNLTASLVMDGAVPARGGQPAKSPLDSVCGDITYFIGTLAGTKLWTAIARVAGLPRPQEANIFGGAGKFAIGEGSFPYSITGGSSFDCAKDIRIVVKEDGSTITTTSSKAAPAIRRDADGCKSGDKEFWLFPPVPAAACDAVNRPGVGLVSPYAELGPILGATAPSINGTTTRKIYLCSNQLESCREPVSGPYLTQEMCASKCKEPNPLP